MLEAAGLQAVDADIVPAVLSVNGMVHALPVREEAACRFLHLPRGPGLTLGRASGGSRSRQALNWPERCHEKCANLLAYKGDIDPVTRRAAHRARPASFHGAVPCDGSGLADAIFPNPGT